MEGNCLQLTLLLYPCYLIIDLDDFVIRVLAYTCAEGRGKIGLGNWLHPQVGHLVALVERTHPTADRQGLQHLWS